MSSFDGIEVGSFSLIVLLNPYLSMSGMNTELDKRVLFYGPSVYAKLFIFPWTTD